MALGTALSIVSGGLGVLGGLSKMISGGRRAKRARAAINDYRRQELVNAYEGVGISRAGGEIVLEEANRDLATTASAATKFGTRGLGLLTEAMRRKNLTNRQVMADWDSQQKTLDRAYAGDQVRIQQMKEQRENADLAGLGQELNVGRQDSYSGLGDISTSMFNTALMYGGLGAGQGNVRGPVKTLRMSPLLSATRTNKLISTPQTIGYTAPIISPIGLID